MEFEAFLPLAMFAVLLGLLMLGFPVAFTIAGTALLFALIGAALDIFRLTDFIFIPSRIFGIVQNITLIAVPLFVFMGTMLEGAGLAKELLESIQILFRRFKGGLAIAVVLVGMLLAASTGIVGATVVTMGTLSLPTMLKWRYNKELACGTIAASGTLGQIIPPSIVLVLLGDMMNVDVGDLFVGAIFPGIVLVGAYVVYILLRVWRRPEMAPMISEADMDLPQGLALWRHLGSTLLPPALLIVIVLGSILGGAASPTEASACGAGGALAITWGKRRLTMDILKSAMQKTALITSMVFTILIGAQFLGVVFRGLGGDDLVTSLIIESQIPHVYVLVFVMLLLFILGFFLDFIEICFIVIPLVAPLLIDQLGFNPLWLSILIAVNLQTSFLTPPFGFALFYLKGVAPPEIKTMDLYRGIIPFVLIQLAVLVLLFTFPQIILWLPARVFGS
jgi:tripartite ATP-independent transporter DctM subunit